MIGPDGVTAIPLLESDCQSPFEAIVQGAGMAHRISATALSRAVAANEKVRALALGYARAFAIQVACTAYSNARAKLEARLARWLLMVGDRQGMNFKVTHEFLATMLAVRRSGVTLAMQILEGRGLIRATRGAVAIIDRDGLVEHANGTYGLPEREYERIFGSLGG